jgi:hypothetical protein
VRWGATELTLETLLREPHVETGHPRRPRRWLRRGTVTVLLLAALIWAGDTATSLLVDHSRLREKLTAHLEAAFGRPVQVGSYGFSIWDGPVLQAYSVRVDEDPRFGYEYFIRADSISVGLRWWSLLRGHIALGTLAVDGASMNLVRSSNGDWNLAEWLPRPNPAAGGTSRVSANEPPAASEALRFRRIEISDSRIDFKRGNEKLPFALVGVDGSMETDAPGRWRIDVTASPWRAAVLTQQPGVIRVTGHIGGTSSRLRPAALNISWTDASIADFFRLARGDDLGIRGDIAIFVRAHTHPSRPINGWVVDGKAEVRGLHRWDMAARPDNPSLNFVVKQALLDPGLSELRASDLRIQAPHSSARASVALNWTGAPMLGKNAFAASNTLELTSSQIDLTDALAWLRAFHSGVPDSTSMRGQIDVRARFVGWPPSLTAASLSGGDAELISAALPGPVRFGPLDLHDNRGVTSLAPVIVAWGKAADRTAASFRIDVRPLRRTALFPSWHVDGNAEDARGVAAIPAALGLNLSHGWDLQGPLSCDLRWQGAQFPWDSRPVGAISLGTDGAKGAGAALRVPFLNLPVEQIRARIQLRPGSDQIALASAKAFGANWNGTFERQSAAVEWQFAASADHLTAANLDRWLNPRWRESFLDRMLPFLGPPALSASSPAIRASGTLAVGQFELTPLLLQHLAGNLRIDGRRIELSDATAQFYGGRISGMLRANLSSSPAYHAEIAMSRVNAGQVVASTPLLAGLHASAIDGRVAIDARGATRGDLISSLACHGAALAGQIGLRGLNLEKASGASSHSATGTRISGASAAFTCSHRTIQFQRLLLEMGTGETLIGSGSIGFDRSLDLHFQDSSTDPTGGAATFRLTGNLASPKLIRVVPARRRR